MLFGDTWRFPATPCCKEPILRRILWNPLGLASHLETANLESPCMVVESSICVLYEVTGNIM